MLTNPTLDDTTASPSHSEPPKARAPWLAPESSDPQPAAPPAPAGPFALVDELLRDRARFLSRLDDDTQLATIARTLVLAIFAASAAFGAALGLHRGGWQVPFAAVKLPLAVLVTAGLSAPALVGLRAVFSGRATVRRDLALVLSALAFASLVVAALAPVVVLAALFEVGYHEAVLLAVACCGLAGAVGLHLLVQGLRRHGGVNGFVLLVSLGAVAIVGAQVSWTLRPFLARPRADVAFLRPVEGDFAESFGTSLDSARGRYRREAAPLPDGSLP